MAKRFRIQGSLLIIEDTGTPNPPEFSEYAKETTFILKSLKNDEIEITYPLVSNESSSVKYRLDGISNAINGENGDAPFTLETFIEFAGEYLGKSSGGSSPSPTPSLNNLVEVTQENFQTELANPSTTKQYLITEDIDFGNFPIVPPSEADGILLVGYDFDVSKIRSSQDNFTLIKSSPIVGGNLVLTGMNFPQFNKTYLEVSGLYGQINSLGDDFTDDDAGNTDYKVFSYDDTGVSGNYFVIINANIGNFWIAIETPVDPSTYVNGTDLLPITTTESLTFTSEIQEGKNVPDSSDSRVSYSGESGGSGNIKIRDLAIEITGANSQVYDLTPIDNFRAIEVNRVNYNNCTSLGEINGYRQGFEQGSGRFGGTPTLTLSGNWGGGYVYTDTIVRILDPGMTELI